MQVVVDWAKGSDHTAFVFFVKLADGSTTICNSVVLTTGETELLRSVFRAQNAMELAATDSQHIKPNMPGEADYMAAATSKGVGSAEAAWCYDWIARHIGR